MTNQTMKTALARIAVTMLVSLLALPLTMSGATVRLNVDAANPMLLSGGVRKTYVRVALTGMRSDRGVRAPVNVAIVLDRSGSMSGAKMAEAKRAAILALDRLRDDDIVSIVTYESTVDVLVPATKLYDRRAIRRAIEGIEASGSTALFAGVGKGARELRKFLDRNRVNSMLLLSDGLANVGPSSPGELAQLGTSLGREGITVTTIGLGLKYNEDLMTRLALASDGNHFFVEEAEDLEAAFATEFGDALSTVAQGVTIHLDCPEGVRPIRVLGRDASIEGQRVHASLNQLYQDQTRYLLVEVEVAPGAAGRVRPVANVTVGFRELATKTDQQLRGDASITYTNSASTVESRKNREVMVAVASQIAAERNKVATALRDEGKIEQAREAFRQNKVYLQDKAVELAAPSLKDEAKVSGEAEASVADEAQWNRARKQQMESNVQVQTQRAPKAAPKKKQE
ncbi:MAG: VWA domain-containing protein [Bryobacterales bacterium]|nr:VWA domain-containing protein [Bryobacterales bacterium]